MPPPNSPLRLFSFWAVDDRDCGTSAELDISISIGSCPAQAERVMAIATIVEDLIILNAPGWEFDYYCSENLFRSPNEVFLFDFKKKSPEPFGVRGRNKELWFVYFRRWMTPFEAMMSYCWNFSPLASSPVSVRKLVWIKPPPRLRKSR